MNKLSAESIIKELDCLLNKRDYDGAVNHLKSKQIEAEKSGDRETLVAIYNEQIGIYRKTQQESNCIDAINCAVSVCKELSLENTVTMGTTYLNAATGLKSFGKDKEALDYYQKAQALYERLLPIGDSRMSGLYNNMAITLTSLGNYDLAESMFNKAIEIKKNVKNGEADIAITYCNLADFATAKYGIEGAVNYVADYLEKAFECLNTPTLPRNGYYAFVSEKCAPVFAEYGYFIYDKILTERAKEIYDRS